MSDGVNHIGDLCRRIRMAKGLEPSDIQGISPSSISKLELNGQIGLGAFQKYVEALGLNSHQRSLLIHKLYHLSKKKEIEDAERRLSKIKFATLKDNTPEECKSIVEELKNERFPSYIRDELWFVHAINKPCLDLFGINPSSLKGGWAGWHIIGSKHAPGSPFAVGLRKDIDGYIPKLLRKFFEETSEIFFTAHMKALRSKLWGLSEHYCHWWKTITSFSAPFTRTDTHIRVIQYGTENLITLEVVDSSSVEYNAGEGDIIRFKKVTWIPHSPREFEVFSNKADPHSSGIYFAAQNTQEYNDWPEIRNNLRKPQ